MSGWDEPPARRARFLTAWAVALATGAMAWVLATTGYVVVDHPDPMAELSYYPSGRHLQPAAVGQANALADLAWLRAVQYYGEHRITDNRFEHMEHIFDVITSLAPGFVPAYVFGAFALAQEGNDFAAAERLMLKGLEANPRSGRLAFEMGFLYYVRPNGRDLDQAAGWFEQASHQPNAPPQARRFAAFARQHSGSLEVAYELWADVLRASPNPALREIAEREMQEIAAALATGQKAQAVKPLATPRVLLVR